MRNIFFVFLVLTCTTATVGRCQTVALDYYFNRETHTTSSGQNERFHYMWQDTANSGFSKWGNVFESLGATLTSIDAAPTSCNLKPVSIYIIVDPDTKKESALPNYISKTDADNIAIWVKAGGVLVLMANDSANVELYHFNGLAGRFGMHFNNDMQNHVLNDNHFEDGAVVISNNPVFKTAKKAFMKDVCSISLKGNAHTLLRSPTKATIAAIAKYGKGTVVAVGDPWLYNEYVNGRLPATFDNDKAALDLAKYLLSQSKR